MKPLQNSRKMPKQAMEKSKKKSQARVFMNASTRSAKIAPAAATPQIELFQMESCPFSHAVRSKLSDLGLDFIAHSVSEKSPLKHEQLVLAGGKDQIPFLVDHKTGTKLYESTAIVAYLDSHYASGTGDSPILKFAQRVQTGLEARKEQIVWTVKAPIEKIQTVRTDLQGAWATIRGSLRMVRDMVMSPATAAASTRAE